MKTLMEAMDVVNDYNVEVCKEINTLTRDIAMLQFAVIEQVVFHKHARPADTEPCDYAEKGLTCAMPL